MDNDNINMSEMTLNILKIGSDANEEREWGECIQQWGVVIERDQAIPSTGKSGLWKCLQ